MSDSLFKFQEMFKEKMSEEFFQDELNIVLDTIKESLEIKAKEYVRNADRMHNFNSGVKKSDKTREEVIRDFRLKHEISIDDMRNDIKNGEFPSRALLEEKFKDVINYFILEKLSIAHKIERHAKK